MRAESRKMSTAAATAANMTALAAGMKSCPFTSVGCLTRIRGQKLRFMASLKMENDPLMSAWLATIAAPVAITTATGRRPCGTTA